MEIQNAAEAPGAQYRSSVIAEGFETLRVRSAQLYLQVKFFGYSRTMDDYEQRKLRIFNQINFFQLLAGMFIPLLGMALPGRMPAGAWFVLTAPACVNLAVLGLNYLRKHEVSLLSYFVLYPLAVCLVYFNGVNPGTELHFVLCVILAVFFLKDVSIMLFTTGFCMVSFFILSVVLTRFTYEVYNENFFIYLLTKIVSLAFLFYGLFLIKKENTVYQFNILTKQQSLAKQNAEIEKQKADISHKAALLGKQTEELTALNAFKSKLFSIIAHDLKSPIYALRNLFQNMHRYNLPAEEVKGMIPAVLTDLNYTTSLMENLLQWAKSQMQNDAVKAQNIDLSGLVRDVVNLLRLQAEAKRIRVHAETGDGVTAYADKDMIHLVLRNLLSNAIKFTPEDGLVEVGVSCVGGAAEVYVQDSGLGISEEGLAKIRQQIFYTTAGTSSETGTGLGLMLCSEFLVKNGSKLQIESTVGNGSLFSFALPTPSYTELLPAEPQSDE